MKKKLYALCMILGTYCYSQNSLQTHVPEAFSFSSTATWKEYVLTAPHITFDKEKWAWTNSFTIKSKKPLKLTNIVLQWRGEKIPQLFASLYQKKERENSVIPIQKNLVCDGIWDNKKQQLKFSLNEKIVAINKYHLVLSYPKEAEKHLKKGKFIITDTKTKSLDTKTFINQKIQLLVQSR